METLKHYYTVLVASQKYHGGEVLTYAYSEKLSAQTVVRVSLQNSAVSGIITGTVSQPAFATKDILEVLDLPVLPSELLELTTWIKAYYPAPFGIIAQQLLPGNLSQKAVSGATVELNDQILPASDLPALTTEQAAVLKRMLATNTYVLHGETGSGKTRVYIEQTKLALEAGRSSIILTPEIGLTSQLASSFRNVFGNQVVLVHSQLTPKARLQTWLKILRSSTGHVPLVVIGPRSALFSPLQSIGLIVVDESHEPAYKQEQAPHYHAVRVAAQLAHLHSATLILGSATPSITDYYIAEQKHKPIIRMTQRATGDRLTEQSSKTSTANSVLTTVVDLKDRTQFNRSQYLSTALLQSIDLSLQRGEQSLLYLNRRGTARIILCNDCGWQAVCPHCDLPLTYHHDLHILQCHTCGFTQTTPTSCPDCGNTNIVFKVAGTKAIEEEVIRLYPNVRTMRFDTDNKAAERFDKHFAAVRAGQVDILVGTQLLAKGLDLPKLSTLGVVIADTSLTFPDYSAEERTYQLLAQVIGRVGRGHNAASGHQERIIVQSYAPDRPVITAALAHDWDSYYAAELHERQLFNFPPFCHLLKLTCRRASSKSAEIAVEKFYEVTQALRLPIIIEGPMPSFHAKVGDKFEWQLIIKTKQRSALLHIIANLKTDAKSGWSYDIDPVNLL